MKFTFNDEQLSFRDAIVAALEGEVTAERIRQRWQTEQGIDEACVAQLRELGLNAMLVPESLGGLGLSAVDFVMIAEACGAAALPEPLVDTVLCATPLLVDVLDRGLGGSDVQNVVDGLVAGELSVAVGHSINPYINFAATADWLLIEQSGALYLLPREEVTLTARKSVDPSRRLQEVGFDASPRYRLAEGDAAAELSRATLNRGALGTAAQLLGLASSIVKQSVQYTSDREQFGRAIGSNQAVKHLLADVTVQTEYARPVIQRAAYTTAVAPTRADCAVSHAKVAAVRAAELAARNGIQCHGAMGYTWECDLQIWVKRAWALAREWGDTSFHKNRIHQWLLKPEALIGPEHTFGRRSVVGVDSQSAAV